MNSARKMALFALFSLMGGVFQASATPSTALLRAYHEKLKAMNLPPGLEEMVPESTVIHQVTLAPLFDKPFVCGEHPLGQLITAGDALGTDCMIVGGASDAAGFNRLYKGSGERNEDWYGWKAPVHAPFDAVVVYAHVNPVVNVPGSMGKPPASMILFRRQDGVEVVYAHVQDIRVKAGDHVKAGDVVAVDGNNGVARNPHVHVGAFRGTEPFQIRWDLAAMGAVDALRAN
ncbi:M23 family metallopeptidase [Asaia spathodeae]|uniref:M23 family metallopeptidase n=1 Tax=Asaia spathodeae TaxID=657016 RepID=UPI002FC3D329